MKRYLIIWGLALLASCATQQHHDFYGGEAGSAVILKSSETIQVESIDGRDVGPGFIGQLHSYTLSPGSHRLIVTFADMYDLSSDDFEKVISGPIKLSFVAEPGKTYHLTHKKIVGIDEARAFALKPALALVNVATGKKIDVSLEYGLPRRLIPKLRFESEDEKVFVSDYTPEKAHASSAAKKITLLQVLKSNWQQASEQERAAFLQWIKQ